MQPDHQLQLKLHQENLLKTFTKISFNNKLARAQTNPKDRDLEKTLETHKISQDQIEGMIMKRLRTLSPKKRQKARYDLSKKLNTRFSMQKNKPPYYRCDTDIISANEFVTQVTQMPVKIMNDSLDFRQEYVKKIDKLNDLFKDNVNSYKNYKVRHKSYQTQDKSKSLFKNEVLTKALSQTSQHISETQSQVVKKMADSIDRKSVV